MSRATLLVRDLVALRALPERLGAERIPADQFPVPHLFGIPIALDRRVPSDEVWLETNDRRRVRMRVGAEPVEERL